MPKDVCDMLRERIVNAYYKPGESLNTMRLAKELQVSRTPIREALIRLSNENLVTIIPNSGARVADINIYDFHHLIDLRLILERGVALLATQNVTEDHIKDLERLFERVKKVKENDFSVRIDCDRKFHQILADAANNPFLNNYLSVVRNQFTRIQKVFKSSSFSVHEDLPRSICLLKQRDSHGMEQLMVEHVEAFVKKVKEKLFF